MHAIWVTESPWISMNYLIHSSDICKLFFNIEYLPVLNWKQFAPCTCEASPRFEILNYNFKPSFYKVKQFTKQRRNFSFITGTYISMSYIMIHTCITINWHNCLILVYWHWYTYCKFHDTWCWGSCARALPGKSL